MQRHPANTPRPSAACLDRSGIEATVHVMHHPYVSQKSRACSRQTRAVLGLFLLLSTCICGVSLRADATKLPEVLIERVPNGGIQPQLLSDSSGTLHLVYFTGDPARGELQYVRRDSKTKDWSKPIQVNRQTGSAIAVGSIRGAQMAIGRNGRIHVAWNGSSDAPTGSHVGAPMLYSRLNDAGTAFEPERDLITKAAGLDGGGSVAADLNGNVYVVWHALIPGAEAGEDNRGVFLARSSNDGRDFAVERQISPANSGACGCCGLRAFAGRDGNLLVLFRGATEKLDRPMHLLTSRDGTDFKLVLSHPWRTPNCPMSSAAFAQAGARTVAAWESDQRVYWTSIKPSGSAADSPRSPSSATNSRHPAISTSSQGATLVAWSEGTGWNKGGAVAWQLFDAEGRSTDVKGRTDGVAVWSFPASSALPNGSFLILY